MSDRIVDIPHSGFIALEVDVKLQHIGSYEHSQSSDNEREIDHGVGGRLDLCAGQLVDTNHEGYIGSRTGLG